MFALSDKNEFQGKRGEISSNSSIFSYHLAPFIFDSIWGKQAAHGCPHGQQNRRKHFSEPLAGAGTQLPVHGGPPHAGPSNTQQAVAHHTLFASVLLCPRVDNRSPHLSFIYLFSSLSKLLSLTITPLSPRKVFSQEEAHDVIRSWLRALW